MKKSKTKRKAPSGLFKRNGIWRIDKRIFGERIQESCHTGDLEEAQRFFAHKLEEKRNAKIYGVRPKRIFREAAIKFLAENQQKRSRRMDALTVKALDPFIGDLPLESVHIGTLQPFIEARRKDNVKPRTINYGLQVTRRILKLAATEWMDENGLTWLSQSPLIKLLDEHVGKRKPYPLSWEEQDRLFTELPLHLKRMALFAVNTGCRADREICKLKWEWEVRIPELDNTSVFIIPATWVKNKDDRLVILNDQAKQVIEEVRGEDPTYVFTYEGKPMHHMLNSAWKKARTRAGLKQVRVHDLKHTFGRRLRSAGVSFEFRQDLLGHRSSRITTHYCAGEIGDLLTAANLVCRKDSSRSTPVLGMLQRENTTSASIPAQI
jgi:integrase